MGYPPEKPPLRQSVLWLAVWATSGLCAGGFCGTLVIDNDEHPWSAVSGVAAWLALIFIWVGTLMLRERARRSGVGYIVASAIMSWFAFAVGIAFALAVSRSAGWFAPLMTLWVIVFWGMGVLPATIAAVRAWSRRREPDPDQ